MDSLVTALDEDIDDSFRRDAAFPNPFDQTGPSPLALVAARRLQADFQSGELARGVPSSVLDPPGSGKMFGVLVVETPAGEIGFLRAFSGMFRGSWDLVGFAPPAFEREERDVLEQEGEANVSALSERVYQATHCEALAAAQREVDAIERSQALELDALRQRHAANRQNRRTARDTIIETDKARDAATTDHSTAFEALADQSRRDKTAKRRLAQEQRLQRAETANKLHGLERRIAALHRLRRFVSRRLMQQIHDTYRIANARGEIALLRELFSPNQPPAGAGDCAGPKLLAYAYRHDLKPLALAEFWWGAPPPTGGRFSGVFYPACRGKCGPLLRHQLDGLITTPLLDFMPPDSSHLDIGIVHCDDRIVVVDKPPGLLSVPSSNTAITDSVAARLAARFPQADTVSLVHRLDLDTSGLLVAGFDAVAHAMLQRQFAKRTVEKRYIAWIDGDVAGDAGTIDLAIRVDISDRPRHVHDPAGEPAVTRWRVLERANGRTRVALHPMTGRTHQLRVHAAHPLGFGAPIVGDNLYGRGGERLLLHAEWLQLRHPTDNSPVVFESPAPF